MGAVLESLKEKQGVATQLKSEQIESDFQAMFTRTALVYNTRNKQSNDAKTELDLKRYFRDLAQADSDIFYKYKESSAQRIVDAEALRLRIMNNQMCEVQEESDQETQKPNKSLNRPSFKAVQVNKSIYTRC